MATPVASLTGVMSEIGKDPNLGVDTGQRCSENLRLVAKHLAILLTLTLAAGTISNMLAGPTRVLAWRGSYAAPPPTPDPPPTPAPPTSGVDPAATPPPAAGPAYEIEAAAAAAEHAKGTLFIDARATDVFDMGHIPGARNIPVWESTADQKVLELMMQVPPPGPRIVVYCQGGHCEDSHMLRQKLVGAGYVDVLIDKDGFPAWEAAGRPVENAP